ncbi:PAS domain-containing sensor histidine kinase [Candidatus Poribacteria bacterium]
MHAPKFYNSIRFQIIMSVVIASLVLMSLSLLWVSYHYRSQMTNSFRDYAINLNDAMEGALEMSMQSHNIDDIYHMIQTLEEREDIEKARILTKDGKIVVSSSQDEIGRKFSMDDEACQVCHDQNLEERTRTVIHYKLNGDQVMRSVNPIANKPSCYIGSGCHSREEKLSGMLMLDYPMQPVMSKLSGNIKEVMLIFAAVGVAVFFLLYFLMNKVIFHKLAHIAEITRLVGKGDIDQRIEAMGDNEISQLAASCNDVIQTLEESTKENEERKNYLTHLINSIEDEIIVIDREYRVVMVNNAAVASRNILVEEAIGMPCYRVSHPGSANECLDDSCPAKKTFDTGKLSKVLHSHYGEDGKARYMEIHSWPLLDEAGEVIQVIEVLRDITERKHLEAQVVYSEKLSSVGRIAAGMAHEIGNPLASIAACAEGLQRRSRDLGPEIAESIRDLPQYLETIKQSAYRCKEITQKILTISRQVEPSLRSVNPNDVLEDILDLVEYEVKSKQKSVSLNLAEQIPYIQADKSQLSQVFLNLIQNGLDAIDAFGEMTITTREISNAIEIIFEDNGCGISAEDLQNIFEPFFTTKPTGKGTGLGLPISESIIREHGGTITVSSDIGIGTTFRIVLPIKQQSPELHTILHGD